MREKKKPKKHCNKNLNNEYQFQINCSAIDLKQNFKQTIMAKNVSL